MCIQAIKSVGVKEYASELWTSIKEIDGLHHVWSTFNG